MSFSLFITFEHEIFLLESQGKSIIFSNNSGENVYVFIVFARGNCRYYKKNQGTFFTKAIRTLRTVSTRYSLMLNKSYRYVIFNFTQLILQPQ